MSDPSNEKPVAAAVTPPAAPTPSDTLSPAEAERLRNDARNIDGGKAMSPERTAMYDDLTETGESGAQGDLTGREDQNTVAGKR